MSHCLESNVMVAMRDGVRLATDLWIPQGKPAPTLLVRLPYGKSGTLWGYPLTPNIFELLAAGYAVVWQDVRGTFVSEGDFTPMAHEADDGVDTIAWIRDQPWSDGSIATYGASYLGFTQWLAASRTPEGLKAQATSVTATDFYAAPCYSDGGAMSWHLLWGWSTAMAVEQTQRGLAAGTGNPLVLSELLGMLAEAPRHLQVPPGKQALLARELPWWSDWVSHPQPDDYWRGLDATDRLGGVVVPTMHVGGWFDIFANETVRAFERMKSVGGSPEAREGQRLIIGPWDHMYQGGYYHDRQFGLMANPPAAGITQAHIQFYDRWLRGNQNAMDGTAPVRIFVMGLDEWRDEQDWPLPDTAFIDYFLDGAGTGPDGLLTPERPAAEGVDTYDYDPANPTPSCGGRMMMFAALNAVGPVDQRTVEARPDVLSYTTASLDEAVEVTGHVSLVLNISSSAVDTDFHGTLVDVHPDGRALYLTDGILRARYRESLERPQPLAPGTTYEIALDLGVTSNAFLPGHRIRLDISSSSFPRYDRNTNTGGVIADESAEGACVATNSVLHGPDHASRLVLPIISR